MTKSSSQLNPMVGSTEFSEISDVLRRTGDTCRDLATSTIWLQDQLSAMVESGRMTPGREASMALQELDRISQILDSLDRLNSKLDEFVDGRLAPTSVLADAIKLTSLEIRVLNNEGGSKGDDEFWS